MRRLERPGGASPTTFTRAHCSPFVPWECPRRLLHLEHRTTLFSSVLPGDVYFHHRWL